MKRRNLAPLLAATGSAAVITAVITAALALATVAGGADSGASSGTGPRYGVAEDASKFADDGGASVYRDLTDIGMSVNRWTAIWDPGNESREFPFLDRALARKPAGIEAVLSVYPDPSKLVTAGDGLKVAPDPDAFCGWVGRVAARYRGKITRFIVQNEPNLATFWPKTNRAATIEATLAACYDAIKQASPAATVIGLGLSARSPSAASTPPITLLTDIGTAYRASGRTSPLFDAIAVHPYPPQDRSIKVTQAPADPNASYQGTRTFYGIATLGRVKAAVASAFTGTGQPTFASGLKLVVDEYGYQVEMTGDSRYSGTETSSTVPDQATQATYYSAAIAKYFACDPDISDVLTFHLIDERDLGSGDGGGGWQSGLEEVDGTHRLAYAAVKAAIAGGCTATPSTPPVTTFVPAGHVRPTLVCNIYGSSGNDVMTTSLLIPITICGLGGDDTITAGDFGGAIAGDNGDDTLTASRVPTVIEGGAGNDTIQACNGVKDTIRGGEGIDEAWVDSIDLVKNVEIKHICP